MRGQRLRGTVAAAFFIATGIIATGSGAAQRPALTCAAGAITCVEVVSTADQTQRNVSVTFGQPFVTGDVSATAVLAAQDGGGTPLAVQWDAIASHPDGSARFAVVSAVVPEVPAKGRVVVNLVRSAAAPAAAKPAEVADLLASGYDFKIEGDLYASQVTQIQFGNRVGTDSGVPFAVGEMVTVQLGDLPEDRYTLPITPDLTGGDYRTLTKIAEQFMALINKGQNFRAYKIGGGGGYDLLWVTARAEPGAPFETRHVSSGNGRISSKVLQKWEPRRRHGIDVRALLAKDGAQGTRLKGAAATEFTVVAPLRDAASGAPHPQLTARIAVRYYPASGKVRTDVTFENAWAYEPRPGNLTYDVAFRQGETTVYEAKAVPHYHHGRWHKAVWWGGEPQVQLRHQMDYFLASRMVWNYDTGIRVPEAILAEEMRKLAAADTGPMGPAFITHYMPTTGGRADIGPYPRWVALYLLSQDGRARASMLANADAAGSVPIHFRDKPTDQPVSLDDHPGLAMNFGKPTGKDAFPELTNGDTPWTPDSAHQPSLAYVPYLVTGDEFYLDEVLFWANYNMGGVNPGYRDGASGLIHPNQVRAQAWALRSLGEAARALPDRHPMKAYFSRKAAGNLDYYLRRYPRNADREQAAALGWMERSDAKGSTAPWQIDLVAIILGQLAETGDPAAEEVFRWLARFAVGRWTSEPAGYCRAMAPAYYINVRTKDGRAIQDWATLFRENWPGMTACPTVLKEGAPHSPSGYVAYSRAMLAVAADLNVEGARAAYDRLRAETPAMTDKMAEDPTWALVPRSPRP